MKTDAELLEFIFANWETQHFGETFGWGATPLNRENLSKYIEEEEG
jgi:hypothetical protein